MAGDKGAAARVFSVEDVARHNTPADCWVIVRGRVYDVTAWAPKHPGGDLLFVKAGGDCTQLFDSYHPLSARCDMGSASRRGARGAMAYSRARDCAPGRREGVTAKTPHNMLFLIRRERPRVAGGWRGPATWDPVTLPSASSIYLHHMMPDRLTLAGFWGLLVGGAGGAPVALAAGAHA